MIDPDRQIWNGMLAHLRKHNPNICRQWFEEIDPLGVAGGVMALRAVSNLHRDYLQRQCRSPFEDALQAVTGRLLSLRFLGPDEQLTPPPAVIRVEADQLQRVSPNGARSGTIHQDGSLGVDPDNSFEGFVVGPFNRVAAAVAKAVGDNPGKAYNPLFIHGGVGLGKSHLLQAVCLRVAEKNPSAVVYYISCEAFLNQFIGAMQTSAWDAFRARFRSVDVLVIDDIQFLTKRERTQEEFFNTFNTLYNAKKQIILSSDVAPEEIPDLEERLVSRFKWGMVAGIEAPDYESRVAIVKSKAALRGLRIPEDVACFIASRVDTNIRELEGALNSVHAEALSADRPIDLEIGEKALGVRTPKRDAPPTIQTITTAVTEYFNVRIADLQSRRRHRSVALPRQVCMFIARRHTRHSLEEIGAYFGGRDHTTVMHAVRTIEERCSTDAAFEVTVRTLEARIR